MFILIKFWFFSYARFDGDKIVPLVHSDEHPFGITTKKAGQIMALEALLESPEKAPLVILKGSAGTGKTYLSLAVGLDGTVEENSIYSRILITAPTDTIGGSDLGYLPGELEKKFNPHLGGIMDNLRVLLGADKKDERLKKKSTKSGKSYHHKFSADDCDDPKRFYVENGQQFFDDGTIEMQLIAYLRGRGLVYLSEKMKESPLAHIITLSDDESVRSPLAKYAATIL